HSGREGKESLRHRSGESDARERGSLRQCRRVGARCSGAARVRGRQDARSGAAGLRPLGAAQDPLPLEARLGRRGPGPRERLGVEAHQRLNRPRPRARRRRNSGIARRREVLRLGRAPQRFPAAAPLGALMIEGRGTSLGVGLRSLSQARLVILLTVTTIGLALPAAFALRPSFREVFAGTLAGDHILRNHADFAPTDVLEFLHEKRSAVAGARHAAIAAALVGLFLQIFFAGGFVETLARGRRIRVGEFLAGAARHFWHNLKSFAIFLPALLLVLAAWIGGMAALGRALF